MHKTGWRRLVAMTAVAGLFAAACGGDDGDEAEDTVASAEASASGRGISARRGHGGCRAGER